MISNYLLTFLRVNILIEALKYSLRLHFKASNIKM